MEPIGKLLNQPGSLVRKSPDGITTGQSANVPEPLWWDKLEILAMDKKHDLAPGILLYWMEKLKSYSDAEICEAIVLYAGEFFPSVDAIAAEVERMRSAKAERRKDIYWAEFERNNRDIEKFKAEHGGKTPQQAWVEENRELIAKIGGGEAALNAQRQAAASAQCMAKSTGAGDMGEKAGVCVEVHQGKPPRKSMDVKPSVSGDGQ